MSSATSLRLRRSVTIILALGACGFAMSAGAQRGRAIDDDDSRGPIQKQKDQLVLKRAIALLTQEGIQARKDAELAHEKPDFNDRFEETPDSEDVLVAIVTRQHADLFVDAYIRWQLTSFDPAWPEEVTDRAFAQIIDAAPRLSDNPKADPRVVTTMEQAEKARTIRPELVEQLKKDLSELDERTTRVASMNRPALEWRVWIADKLGESGKLPRLWMLENLGAFIAAGWEDAGIRGEITRNFTESTADETFTADDRAQVVQYATRLVGPGRRFFGRATWFANNSVNVTFSSTGISQADVEHWGKRLAGIVDQEA